MARIVFVTLLGAAVSMSAGYAAAQSQSPTVGNQPPAKQSAPPESPQAAGHDAQTGKPETGPNATQAQNPSTDHDVDGSKAKTKATEQPAK
jgi:hypothetical protein